MYKAELRPISILPYSQQTHYHHNFYMKRIVQNYIRGMDSLSLYKSKLFLAHLVTEKVFIWADIESDNL